MTWTKEGGLRKTPSVLYKSVDVTRPPAGPLGEKPTAACPNVHQALGA